MKMSVQLSLEINIVIDSDFYFPLYNCHFSKANCLVLNVHTCHTAYQHVKRVINIWYQNAGINHVFFFFLMKQLQVSVAKMATNENICSINSCFRSSEFEKKSFVVKGFDCVASF